MASMYQHYQNICPLKLEAIIDGDKKYINNAYKKVTRNFGIHPEMILSIQIMNSLESLNNIYLNIIRIIMKKIFMFWNVPIKEFEDGTVISFEDFKILIKRNFLRKYFYQNVTLFVHSFDTIIRPFIIFLCLD